ncbi:N-acetyltransferase family protein [Herbidospora sp. RD11066]
MTFEIAVARPEDAEALGEIHAEAWLVAYRPFFDAEFFERAVARRRGQWHAIVAEGVDSVLVACHEGRPRAFSRFGPSRDRPGWGEVWGFYGHPASWGTGIAAALMAATVSRMADDGFASAHLWTLRDTPQSRRFYRKAGFEESGASRRYDFGEGRFVDQVEYHRPAP